MFVYWFLFFYFAVGAALEQTRLSATHRAIAGYAGEGTPSLFFLRLGGLLIALVVGLRYRVGADWKPYMSIFRYTRSDNFTDLPSFADPGYYFLNIVAQRLDGGLWIVNLACALIFAWGLIRFAETRQRPWLAVVVAVPYLVIVVAMGYTRQAVSIGLIMAGLAAFLNGGSKMRLIAYIALAATFHRTAVVVLPLVLVGNERGRLSNLLVAATSTYVLYYLFLESSINPFIRNYWGARYESQGAGIRIAMITLPAMLFFIHRRTLGFTEIERRIWRNLSLAAAVLLGLLFVLPSSTAVDRLALYIIPLQIAIMSKPRSVFSSDKFGTFLIILYSALIQFTWFTFASHAEYWVPYRFWPF